MRDKSEHTDCVDVWLSRSSNGLPTPRLLDLFEAALRALWERTTITLGEVTLTAISDRVVHTAREKFPIFASLEIEPNSGIRCGSLGRDEAIDRAVLLEGIRFILVEFLSVLGNLTADILTPELHAELLKVDLRDTRS